MGLKSIFNAVKKEGHIIQKLDLFLMKNNEESDRAINVNAPSQAGSCLRANYYSRTQMSKDGTIEPRTQRIFDNGSKTHERLQEYMLKMQLLLMDEVPLRNEYYNIQGHTDGFLKLNLNEVGILEIKSINENGFKNLVGPKEEHKRQAMVYLFCAEERRVYLKNVYPSRLVFNGATAKNARRKYHESNYQHLKDGSKHTREEKIKFQVDRCMKADEILYNTNMPITKVVFLYENKNDQDLKEFTVSCDEVILKEVLDRYAHLNICVFKKKMPDREGTTKSAPPCKWCDYKIECWC